MNTKYYIRFRNNIQYGDVEADSTAMIEAAQCARIHEKVLSFPDKYDTKVGSTVLEYTIFKMLQTYYLNELLYK